MSTSLQSWPRPHFTPGGGDALLFYVVFGEFDLTKPFSLTKYRSNGPADWLEVVQYDRARQPEVFAEYQSGPMWEKVTRDACITAAEAEKAPHAVAVRAAVTDPETLDYFRDTIGVVMWLLDVGGISAYDPQRLWLWTRQEWQIDVFGQGKPSPQEHVVILISDEDGGTQWIHTRGMRQYGRPDLSVHGVGPNRMDIVTRLIDRFIQGQADGQVIPEGQEIRMAGLPPGGVCRHAGDRDDPDFNNVHVEIEWPKGCFRNNAPRGWLMPGQTASS